jgi:hypothetical protein
VVLPGRLRVEVDASATDDVVLTVPPQLTRLRLLLGGEERSIELDGAEALPPVALDGTR